MCTVCKTNWNQDHRFYVGKNYDAPDPCRIMVFVNPPGVEKQALIAPPEEPARWRSVYGSVTCNQVCKDFPVSGMNEAGLIVEQTTLWNTVYPDRDPRPAIKETQWIQYMLDTCASTGEVIEKSEGIRISQEAARLQYFICDRSGDACIISYIMGEMTLIRGNEMPHQVIANDMYGTSLDYLGIHAGYGGKRDIAPSDMSLDRFAAAADAVARHTYDAPGECFAALDRVSFDLTQWSIVYDPVRSIVLYRSKGGPAVKQVDLAAFALGDMRVPLVRDMDTGDGVFETLTVEKNLGLIKYFFEESRYFPEVKVTKEDMEMLARW